MTDTAGCFIVRSSYVFFKRAVRYAGVGRLLHLVSIGGLVLFFYSGKLALIKMGEGEMALFWGFLYLSLYGLVLIWFSQKDALCRFQNYKLAKDLFYENRGNLHQIKRVCGIFSASKCQREAIRVAGADLGISNVLADYYREQGYRWYHLIPDRVLNHPKVLFTRRYWKRTLFVPTYHSKYFLW